MEWLVVFQIGLALAGGSLAYSFFAFYLRRQEKPRRLKVSDLSASLQAWVEKANRGMRTRFWQKRNAVQVALMLVLCVLGLGAGLVFLKNPAAALVMGIGGFVIPEQIYHMRELARKNLLLEQMNAVVRTFAAEFGSTPHVARALGITAEKIPEPAGGVLRRAYRRLTAGYPLDDVLIEMGREFDSEYGRMFVQLLRLAAEDEAVKPLFSKLSMRLAFQQDLLKKNRATVAADRAMLVGLNLAIIPAFIFIHQLIPESHQFFVETQWGRIIVFLTAVSVVAAAALDRIIGGSGVSD